MVGVQADGVGTVGVGGGDELVRKGLEGKFEVEAVEGLVLEGVGDGAVVLEKVDVDVCAGWGGEVGDRFSL